MKLKYYLRGAGIGVIVSTLILMIAFGVYQRNNRETTPAETENTAQELTIAEALSELETETKPEETETEEQAAVPEVTETEEQADAPEETEAEESAAASEETEAAPQPEISEAQEETAGEGTGADAEDAGVTVKKTVSVVVRSGDSPMVVSRMLAEVGVVDDADLFYRYLLDHGLNDGIEIGSFSIPEGADYETVAKLITTNEFESRMQR